MRAAYRWRFAWWPFDGQGASATFALTPRLPWALELRGGLSAFRADLRTLDLRSLQVLGGASDVSVSLPRPSGTVLVRLVGGASDVLFRRPAGAEARLRVTGGAASLTFDAQRLGAVGGTVRLETPGWATATDRYDFEITGGAAGLEVTTA